MPGKDFVSTPPTRCPRCRALLDAVTKCNGRAPSQGDISVCFVCATFLQVNADMSLTEMDAQELAVMARCRPGKYAAALTIRNEIYQGMGGVQ